MPCITLDEHRALAIFFREDFEVWSYLMDFGLHLPLIDFGSNPFTLDYLIRYAETSQELLIFEI